MGAMVTGVLVVLLPPSPHRENLSWGLHKAQHGSGCAGGLARRAHHGKCPVGISGVGRESVSVWLCGGVQTAGAWSASS